MKFLLTLCLPLIFFRNSNGFVRLPISFPRKSWVGPSITNHKNPGQRINLGTLGDQAVSVQGSDDNNKSVLQNKWYQKYLDLSERRPYITKAVSASVIVGLGAILSQYVEARSRGELLVLNWHLVRAFALTGLVFEGPYLHWWYEQLFRLGRFLRTQGMASARARTTVQIAVDETIGVLVFFPTYFVVFELAQSLLLLRGER
jgi:hypothetical protein